MVATKAVYQVVDTAAHPGYTERRDPAAITAVELGGVRTCIAVPMLKENELIGSFSLYRQEVRPFTDKQVALVASFANQAVIAIENTRLLSELRESLARQTATADVLSVISSSPGDLKPVFDAMLGNAARLCEAQFGNLLLYEGEAIRIAAMYNIPAAFAERFEREPVFRAGPLAPASRAASTKDFVHVVDLREDPAYREGDPPVVALVDGGGARSLLLVPMLKEGEAIGALSIFRREVRPFTDKQIDLVKSFAAQAVIAIENARLLSELRELLAQQTATAEVLGVISSSPGSLDPVFKSMLENAARLCEANFGVLVLHEGGDAFRAVAMHNAPPEFAELRRREPAFRSGALTPLSRMVATKQLLQIADLTEDAAYKTRDPTVVGFADTTGVRTLLLVPMLKDAEAIGAIAVYRTEVRPFADKQIELVKNFAAQAVIAIENTRLLTELRQRTTDLTESLEQQTATSEVLQVISASPGDLEPVFATTLENAVRICGAKFGNLWLRDGDLFRIGATHGAPAAWADFLQRERAFRADPRVGLGQVLATKQTYQVSDVTAAPTYRDKLREATIKLSGARSLIGVPLLRDDEVIGCIAIYRQEVQPFTDKQIEVVQNFAAQAVIAIENARLLSELRESLEQQTATSEVLKVISSSPGDLEPVFATMLENAVRICDAKFGNIYRWDGGVGSLVAAHNTPAAFAEARRRAPFGGGTAGIIGRMLAAKTTIHIADLTTDQAYVERSNPATVAAVELGGVRTIMAVPMLKENELVGSFTLYRQEVRPFTDKQIALVTGFAAQAVIAIENARLLSELRQRTDELGRSVGELRALGEVSQAVNSTLDLETVLSTIVAKAVQLSNTDAGAIYVYRRGAARIPAARHLPDGPRN